MVSKRLKFFLVHLGVSLCIALMIISLVFLVWYPTPLAKAVGVTHIFLMMLAIDVTLGPILGLIVYKTDKIKMLFDFSIIILLQLSALSYGVYSIAQGRPVWIVYDVDRFQLVCNNDIVLQPDVQVKPEYQKLSFTGAQYAAIQLSTDKKQQQNDLLNAAFGLTLAQQPDRYVSIDLVKHNIQKHAKNLAELNQYNDQQQVMDVLGKYPQANAFVPLKANVMDMTVLLDKDTGKVVKIVDLRPWK